MCDAHTKVAAVAIAAANMLVIRVETTPVPFAVRANVLINRNISMECRLTSNETKRLNVVSFVSLRLTTDCAHTYSAMTSYRMFGIDDRWEPMYTCTREKNQ